MNMCERCRSYAINLNSHGRDGKSHPNLCDVCYWRTKYEELQEKIKHER